MDRIVLACAGGLDTLVAIPWLAEHYQAEIVAVTLDLGQEGDLTEIRERALAAGAVRAHVIDAREELVRDFILPALQVGVGHERRYSLATGLARPLIAKRLVEVARMERAAAMAHGCLDEAIDRSARALDPTVRVIAPARTWAMSRTDKIEYARAKSIAVPAFAVGGAPSTDANLWGRSVHAPSPADAWVEPSDDLYVLTRPPKDCPDEPAYLEIEFDAGVPVRANGIEMPMLELIESLEIIAGAHGVGRSSTIGNGTAAASRKLYEAPAAVVLHGAHGDLEKLVTDRDLQRLKDHLAATYADLIDNGLWFSAARTAIDAFVRTVQPRVTGSVRLKLFKGNCQVVGLKSPFSVHDSGEALCAAGDRGDAAAAPGRFS